MGWQQKKFGAVRLKGKKEKFKRGGAPGKRHVLLPFRPPSLGGEKTTKLGASFYFATHSERGRKFVLERKDKTNEPGLKARAGKSTKHVEKGLFFRLLCIRKRQERCMLKVSNEGSKARV